MCLIFLCLGFGPPMGVPFGPLGSQTPLSSLGFSDGSGNARVIFRVIAKHALH